MYNDIDTPAEFGLVITSIMGVQRMQLTSGASFHGIKMTEITFIQLSLANPKADVSCW